MATTPRNGSLDKIIDDTLDNMEVDPEVNIHERDPALVNLHDVVINRIEGIVEAKNAKMSESE